MITLNHELKSCKRKYLYTVTVVAGYIYRMIWLFKIFHSLFKGTVGVIQSDPPFVYGLFDSKQSKPLKFKDDDWRPYPYLSKEKIEIVELFARSYIEEILVFSLQKSQKLNIYRRGFKHCITYVARAAVVHLNFRAGSTFPVPVYTVSPGHWVN